MDNYFTARPAAILQSRFYQTDQQTLCPKHGRRHRRAVGAGCPHWDTAVGAKLCYCPH